MTAATKTGYVRSAAGCLLGVAVVLLLAGGAWGQPAAGNWGGAYEIYQVRPGDTVQNIAARFGVSPDLISNFNALLGPGELVPGQDLAIPLPGAAGKEKDEGAASVTARMLPPRYAVVTKSCQITSEPDGGDFFFEPAVGTKLVVKVERGTHWGVVMVNGSIGWIDKDCLEMSNDVIPAERFDAMLHGGRPDIVQEAAKYMGVPYRYGGSLPANVDCSLLVQTAHAALGLRLPRTAAAQFEVGRQVNYNELQPGDRVYFVNRSGRINHTALYIGNGQFIHASSRRGCVGVDSLSDSFYWSRFIGARRF